TGATTAGAPGLLHVVRVLLFLDPDLRLRKQVDTIDVVRVHVREDDVRDLVGLDSQALESLIRPREIGDAEVLEKLLPIEARIDQDCPTAGVFQHPRGSSRGRSSVPGRPPSRDKRADNPALWRNGLHKLHTRALRSRAPGRSRACRFPR